MKDNSEAARALVDSDMELGSPPAKAPGSIAAISSPGVGIGEEMAVYDEPRDGGAAWPGEDGSDFKCGAYMSTNIFVVS